MAKNIDSGKFKAMLEDQFGNITTAIAIIGVGDFTKNAFKRGYISNTLADSLEYKYGVKYESYSSEEPVPLPARRAKVKEKTPAEEETIELLVSIIGKLTDIHRSLTQHEQQK